jgi:hypothetical protein
MVYKTQTTWPGLVLVLTGVPAYLLWKRLGAPFSDRKPDDTPMNG